MSTSNMCFYNQMYSVPLCVFMCIYRIFSQKKPCIYMSCMVDNLLAGLDSKGPAKAVRYFIHMKCNSRTVA